MTLAYWNGHYMPLDAVKVSPLDRGFVFGDGVYEVVAFYGTEAFELDAHLARLARSLAEIGIASIRSPAASPRSSGASARTAARPTPPCISR